jgi:hypothetical protein
MTVESAPVMGRTPGGGRDLRQAHSPRLGYQPVAEIEVPRPRPISRYPAAQHYFRSYLITHPTNSYTTMHYNLAPRAVSFCLEALEPAGQDPPGGAAPARVQESDTATGRYQINRNTVSDGDGEQDAWCRGNPAVDVFDLDPAVAGIEGLELDPVHLIAESNSMKAGKRAAEREPPAHDLADGLLTPKTEIESASFFRAAAGDARGHAILFLPAWDFVSGDGPGDGSLAELR